MYCIKCGKEIQREAQFCSSCGTALAGVQSHSTNPYSRGDSAPSLRPAAVKTMRGGWLAVKGFLIALFLSAVGNGAITQESLRAIWVAIALGVGTAYIFWSIRKWNREKVPVKEAGTAWLVAAILALSCVGSLSVAWTREFDQKSDDAAEGQPSPTQPPVQAVGKTPTPIKSGPDFSSMTVAQHMKAAKDLINPTASVQDLHQADEHLKAVLKRSPNNAEVAHLYDLATLRAKKIAEEMDHVADEQSKQHPQDTLAWVKCGSAATENLKAPSTANFASYSRDRVKDLGSWRYQIRSYVDSQNCFGAQVRTGFTCTVQCAAVGVCSVTDLTFDQ